MIEELVKEKRLERDQQETNKMFNAIHEQAYWKRLDEENKRMMNNIDKELRKPTKKDKIKEVLKHELEIALLMVISAPGLIAWILLSYCLTH